jgi:hypothetical protein
VWGSNRIELIKMKLKSTMFHDPDPEIEDYRPEGSLLSALSPNAKKFKNDKKEWSRRQVKPEEPDSIYSNNSELAWSMRKAKELQNWQEWKDYFAALRYYNDHRQRWSGFEPCEEQYHGELAFTNDVIFVVFETNHAEPICCEFQIIDKAVYRGEVTTVELIELMCSENGAGMEVIESM